MLDPTASSLESKIALVTGSGSGIGRSIAETFAAHGASLVVVDRDAGLAREVASAIEGRGSETIACVADVCTKEGVEALSEAALDRFGRVDVLVNNVGNFMPGAGPFLRSSEEDWEGLYELNLKHVFRCTQAFAPGMVERGSGSIINVSTVETLRGIPFNSIYSAFKTAITGFTRSFALEVAPSGVRVNAIAPETTDTNQVPVHRWIPEKYAEHIPRMIPLGRFGRPDDHAGAALFLASELSSWVTGVTLPVDGGAIAASGFYRLASGAWTNAPIVADAGIHPD
ncbi:MAG: glucose 1-dehydrogenase [Deltaproteobacteria bacterium]|jgi:NAD(P)-dependent dehydrogenase (short-subunit alcohol dehydrogenase family)|nr:glucose 1-dehydrogenase [Deltaproteobacteria bacterium]